MKKQKRKEGVRYMPKEATKYPKPPPEDKRPKLGPENKIPKVEKPPASQKAFYEELDAVESMQERDKERYKNALALLNKMKSPKKLREIQSFNYKGYNLVEPLNAKGGFSPEDIFDHNGKIENTQQAKTVCLYLFNMLGDNPDENVKIGPHPDNRDGEPAKYAIYIKKTS